LDTAPFLPVDLVKMQDGGIDNAIFEKKFRKKGNFCNFKGMTLAFLDDSVKILLHNKNRERKYGKSN